VAQIERTSTGECLELQVRTIVGRASSADLVLPETTISSEHATIFFAEGHWVVRDLSSTNGTWVNRELLQPGVRMRLHQGDRLAFGGSQCEFRLIDDSPPLQSGAPDTLVLGVALRDVCIEIPAFGPDPPHLWIQAGPQRLAVRERACSPLLRALAEAKLKSGAVWVPVSDLVPALYSDTETLNVQIFRARRLLADIGIRDADHIVQRQIRSKRLRIGECQVRAVDRPPEQFQMV
jgi:FHA domain